LRGSFKGPATAEICCAKQEVQYTLVDSHKRDRAMNLRNIKLGYRVTDEGKSQTLRLFDGFQKK
jgi:hypothetical protein